MRCDQEMCPFWAGDAGCPCAVLGIDRERCANRAEGDCPASSDGYCVGPEDGRCLG